MVGSEPCARASLRAGDSLGHLSQHPVYGNLSGCGKGFVDTAVGSWAQHKCLGYGTGLGVGVSVVGGTRGAELPVMQGLG